jgi:CheY-like chemotaxis protein
MMRVLVTQWNAETIPATLATIEAAGATVVGVESEDAAKTSAQLQNLQPDVLLIEATYRTSHARMLAAAARSRYSRQKLSILFLATGPEELPVSALQSLQAAVPDALHVTPPTLATWLQRIATWKQARAPAT